MLTWEKPGQARLNQNDPGLTGTNRIKLDPTGTHRIEVDLMIQIELRRSGSNRTEPAPTPVALRLGRGTTLCPAASPMVGVGRAQQPRMVTVTARPAGRRAVCLRVPGSHLRETGVKRGHGRESGIFILFFGPRSPGWPGPLCSCSPGSLHFHSSLLLPPGIQAAPPAPPSPGLSP